MPGHDMCASKSCLFLRQINVQMHDPPSLLYWEAPSQGVFICSAPYIYIQSLFSAGMRIFLTSSREQWLQGNLEEPMSIMPAGADQWARRRNPTPVTITPRQRIAGLVLRTILIVSLVIVTLHVSMPQSASIWTAYNAPGDFIRLALGLAVCLWVGVQLFAVPKDPAAYRTWLYLGLAAVPFVLICIIGIW
jgi:hypothetical protein